ncbi:MAG: AI-2E family transporter [Candidatus Peribacteraceae bacterium]
MATAVVITLAIAGAVLFTWYTADALLVGFAGILLAIGFSSVREALERRMGLRRRSALAATFAFVLLLLGLIGWVLVPSIAGQLQQVWENIPSSVTALQAQPWFLRLERLFPGLMRSLPSVLPLDRIAGFLSATYNAFFQIVLAVFVGIALTLEPSTYVQGFLTLFPRERRGRVAEVLAALYVTLRRWLLGQLLSMIAVGVLTAVGLTMVGMPFALSLGALAGLLEFIPTLGPFLAAVPAVLLAFLHGPWQALLVAGVYLIVQSVESYLLVPFIHRYTVSVPPVVAVIALVLLGVLLGPLGVLLAMPLTASIVVLVRMLYIEDVLGERNG